MDADDRRAIAADLRERAEAALADVHEAFGDAPRREALQSTAPDYAPDTFPASVDEQIERIAGIAGAWVTDDDGRVLCVDVTYNDVPWQTPGGAVEQSSTSRRESEAHPSPRSLRSRGPRSHAREDAIEPGESLPETARTETREETGIEIALTGVAYTRLVEIVYDDAVPETVVVPMAVFTADPVGGSLESGGNTLPDGRDEIADARWFEPANLPEGTLDRERLVEYCEGE